MDDASFVGRHGFEYDRASVFAHAVRHPKGQRLQRFLTAPAVSTHIDRDWWDVLESAAYDEVHEVLKRGERCAAPPDEDA